MIDIVKAGLAVQAAIIADRRWRGFQQTVHEMVGEHGLCNVVATVAAEARERERVAPEGSPAERDWRTCADALERCAHECDLRNAK